MFIQKKIILEENLSLMHNHPFSLFPTIWISLKLINRYDFNKVITIIIIIKNNRNLTFDRPSILWIPSISSVIPAAKTTNTTKLEWSTERVLPVYTRPRQATDPQSTSVTILSSVMNNLLQWQLLETADGRRVQRLWNFVFASRGANFQAEIVAKFRRAYDVVWTG